MSGLFSVLYARKIAFTGMLAILTILVFAIFAPLITPYDPTSMNPLEKLEPPSASHLFGTDNFGRDTFSRVVYGARMSLLGSTGVVVFATIFGVAIGTLCGYFKSVELVLMRIVDVLMSFPPLLLALVLVSIMGRGLVNVIIAVGVTYLTRTTRIIYGMTLKIKEEPYIEASYASGATTFRILLRHVVPNLMSPLIVQSTFTFAFSLLEMASLDFLGLGIPPAIPSWGNMLSEGSIYLTRAPWLLLFPGSFIVVTVLSLNLVGDVLRDRLDPRFRAEISGV